MSENVNGTENKNTSELEKIDIPLFIKQCKNKFIILKKDAIGVIYLRDCPLISIAALVVME